MLRFTAADGIAIGTQAASLGVRPPPNATSLRVRCSFKRRLLGVCLLKPLAMHNFANRKGHVAAAIDATGDFNASPSVAAAATPHHFQARPVAHIIRLQCPRQSVTLFTVAAAAMHSRSQFKLQARRGSVEAAATMPAAAAAATGVTTSTALAAAMSLCGSVVADTDTPQSAPRGSVTGETACAAGTPVDPMSSTASVAHAVIGMDNIAARQQPTASPSPATSAAMRSQGNPSTSYSCSGGAGFGCGTEFSPSACRNATTWRDLRPRPRVKNKKSRGGVAHAEPFLCRSAAAPAAAAAGARPAVLGDVLPLSGAALTNAIMKCGTWQELAQVLVPAAAALNHTHVAAALMRLAKMQEASGAAVDPGQGLAAGHGQRRRRRGRRRRPTPEQLKSGRERVSSLDLVVQDPGRTLELDLSFDAGTSGGSSGDGAEAAAAARDGGGTPSGSSGGGGPLMAAAYVSPEELTGDLASLALTRFLRSMSAREVSNIAWALAQLTPSLLRAPQRAAAAVETTPQSTPAPAFSRYAIATALRAVCAAHWEDFNPQELATLLYSMVKLDPTALDPRDAHRQGAWLAAWFAASERDMGSLGPRGLTVVLWALVQIWGCHHTQAEDPLLHPPFPADWSARMRARLTSQMPHIYPTALVQVAWGLARLQPWLLPMKGFGSAGLPPGAGAGGTDMMWGKCINTAATPTAAPGVGERNSWYAGATPAQVPGPCGAPTPTPTPAAVAAVAASAAPVGADTGAAELLALLTRSAIRKAPQLESHRDLAQLSWAIGKLQELVWRPKTSTGEAAARSAATITRSVEAAIASGCVKLEPVESAMAQRAQVGFRGKVASSADPDRPAGEPSPSVRPAALGKEEKDTAEVEVEAAACATFRAAMLPAAQPAFGSAPILWLPQQQPEGQGQQPGALQTADWDQGPIAGWDDVARAEPEVQSTLWPQPAKREELVSLIARPLRPRGSVSYPAMDGAAVPIVQAELRPPLVRQRNGHESIHAVLQPPLPSDALPPPNLRGDSFGGESERGRDSIDRTGAEDYGGSWEEQQRRHPPRPAARRMTITSQAPPLQVQQQQQPLHGPQHWQCPESPLRMVGQDVPTPPTPLTTTHHHQQQQKYPQRQRLGFQHWHPLRQQQLRQCTGTVSQFPRHPSRRGKGRGGSRVPRGSSGPQLLDVPPRQSNPGGPQLDRVAQLGRCVLQRWEELCNYATPTAAGSGHSRRSSGGGGSNSNGLDDVVGHDSVQFGDLGGTYPYPVQPSGVVLTIREQGAGCQQHAVGAREQKRIQRLQPRSRSPPPGSTQAREWRPTATDVAVISWACFRMGWEPPTVLVYRWAQLALRRPEDFTPQGLANILQLASTRWEMRRLLAPLAAVVLRANRAGKSGRSGAWRGGGPSPRCAGDEAVDNLAGGARAPALAVAVMRRARRSLAGAAAPGAVMARTLMALARAQLRVRHWPRRRVGAATAAGSSNRRRRYMQPTAKPLNGSCNVAGAQDTWEQSNGSKINCSGRTLAINSICSDSDVRKESTGSSGGGSSGRVKSDADYRGDSRIRGGSSGGSRTLHRHSDISNCGAQISERLDHISGHSCGSSDLQSRCPAASEALDSNEHSGPSPRIPNTTGRTGGNASGSCSGGTNAKAAIREKAVGGRVYGAPPCQSRSRQPSAKRPRKPGEAMCSGSATGSSKDLAAAATIPVDSEAASAAARTGWRRLIGWLPPLVLCHSASPHTVASGNAGDVFASNGLQNQQQQGWSSKQTDAVSTASGEAATRVTLARGVTKDGPRAQRPKCMAEDLIVAATAASRLRIRPNRLELARVHAALLRLPGYMRPPSAAADDDVTVVVNGMTASRQATFGAGSSAVDTNTDQPTLEACGPLPGVPDSKLVPLAVALARLQQRAFGYPNPAAQRGLATGAPNDGGRAAAVAAAKAELAEALIVRSAKLMRRWQLPLRDLAVLGWAVGVMVFAEDEVGDVAGAPNELLANNIEGGLQRSTCSSLRAASSASRNPTDSTAVQVSPGFSWQAADGTGNTWDAVDAGRRPHPHAVSGPAGCVSASEALVEWCKVWSESIWAYSIVSAPVPELCAVLSAWAALRWRVDGRMQARVLGRLVPELPVLEAHRLRALSATLESLGWRLPPAWADWLAECRAESDSSATATANASISTATIATVGANTFHPSRGRASGSTPAVFVGHEEDGKQPVQRLPPDMRTHRCPQ